MVQFFNDYVVFYGNLTGVQVESMNGKVVDESSESVHVMDMDSTLGHYMSCFSISLALYRMFNVVVFFNNKSHKNKRHVATMMVAT